MDLVYSSDEPESVIEDGDASEDTAFEGERCGICTDAVIDRGVLDCCSHWFCFACIDNWAAITNLCPLCKNEFQLITCLPVYDTIGSIKVEENSFPRDEDWFVQGNNNTLSFPSYYIDEDAVVCLDGDRCKIRSGLATFEEDLTYDTSIACDSCDIWYHAFCVGFNPECASQNSWLCPRCITNDVQQKSDGISMQNLGKLSSANLGWTIDPSFSGKVSVSVADAGETAVVVSMVEGKQMIEASKSSSERKLDSNIADVYVADAGETAVVVSMVEGKQMIEASKSSSERKLDSNIANEIEVIANEIEASIPDAVAGNVEFDVQIDKSGCIEFMSNNMTCSDEKGFIANASQSKNCSEIFLDISPEMAGVQTDVDLEGKQVALPSLQDSVSEMTVLQPCNNMLETSLPLSLSQNVPLSSPDYFVTHGDSKISCTEETLDYPFTSDGFRISSPLSFETSANMNDLFEDKSVINITCGLPGVSSSSVVKEVDGSTENHMVKSSSRCASELSCLPEDKMVSSTSEETIDVSHQKDVEVGERKQTEKFQSHAMDDHVNNWMRERERGLQVKMEGDCPAKKAKSDRKSQISPSIYGPQKQPRAADIMSIVQETTRSNNISTGTNSMGISIEKRENADGLRVKKIMRRVGDKKESSILVQKLRNEIKEVVQDRSSNIIDKDNAFDSKLLTAFRAAIVRPVNESVNKSDPSVVQVKKSLLQKGKVRENLTKKLYGTSTGKRRRAWDREWEIEFWKHRCKKMKPEKVETLQSVLELLKKATSSCFEDSEMDQGREGETKNSILSRVYLADASVFPRKEDIRPLSALAECSVNDNLEKNKGNSFNNLSKKDSQAIHGNNLAENPSGISAPSSLVSSYDNLAKRSSTSREASCKKGNLDGSRSGPTTISGSSSSKGREQTLNEQASQLDNAKSDKRKWALEVLARKNGLANSNASKEKQEDSAALKENYPLLAQLPIDMRPVLAPSRHNKVPVSVRQAQLHRITEHYLRRINLPVIRRTAETELAVADAVNVEKDIFEKSNSKLVYVNLSSQFLSQLAKKSQPVPTSACDSLDTTADGTDLAAEEASSDPAATGCNKVEEALKLAGLSDSPPNSPYRPVKCPDKEDETRVYARDEALESVLDIDSHTELDIYGDFEYDLEDEGYTVHSSMVNALRMSKVQPENGDSRMKVMFSTLQHDTPKPSSSEVADTPKPPRSEVAGNDKLRAIEVPSEPSTLLECKSGSNTGDVAIQLQVDVPLVLESSQGGIYKEPSIAECEELYGPEREPLRNSASCGQVIGKQSDMEIEPAVNSTGNSRSKNGIIMSVEAECCSENNFTDDRAPFDHESCGGQNSPTHSLTSKNTPKEGKTKFKSDKFSGDKLSDSAHAISKKVETYVKEHIRPLCKSGVITAGQYRWAVGKTTDKVMKFHYKAKNANFLIKEGEKVKKLAEQYVEAAQLKKLE